SGIASVGSAGTNSFNVTVPGPSLSVSGSSLTVTQGTAVSTVTLATPVTPTITGTGVATAGTISPNSFTVDVPAPSYNNNTGAFTTGTNVITVAPTLSLTGNVLSSGPGSNSVTLPSAVTPTINGLGAATAGTSAANVYTVNVPPTNVTSSGLGTVTSAGTNSFNINVPAPVLTSNSNTITVTQGTAVSSATVPSAPNTSLISTGAATTATLATNSFSINVPQSTLTSSGIGTITSAGTNSFNINIPQTSLTGSGTAVVSGSFPNYTITTPSIPSPTVIGTGAAVVSPTTGLNFTVNVPQSTLTSSGVGTITTAGTNSFDINVPATGIVITTTAGSAGVSTLSTNNFNINIPAAINTSLVSSGAATTATLGTNSYSINVPQGALTSSGIGTVTTAGTNSFNINIPAPVLSSSSNTITITQGTAVTTATVPSTPNTSLVSSGAATTATLATNSFSINVPQGALTSSGIGTVTTAGTNSFNINIPAPVLTSNSNTITITQGTAVTTATVPSTPNTSLVSSGAASTATLATNSFSINVPQGALTSSGIGTVTTAGTNSFNINIPAPVLTSNSNTITITQGTAVTTATVPSTPNTSLVSSGAATTATLATNSFSINVPQGTLTSSGIGTVTTAGTNSFNINIPAPSIAVTTTAGAAGVSSASPASFSINIPPAANSWSVGGNSITTPATEYFGSSNASDVQFKTNNTYRMMMKSGGGILVNGLTTNPAIATGLNIQGAEDVNFGQMAVRGPSIGVTSRGFMSFTDNNPSRIGIIGDFQAANSDMYVIGDNNMRLGAGIANYNMIYLEGASGRVGVNQTAPGATLDVNGTFKMTDGSQGLGKVLTSDAAGLASWASPTSFAWSTTGNAGTGVSNFLGTSDAQPLMIRTNSVEVMRINVAGNVGIGSSAPAEDLQLERAGNTNLSIISGAASISALRLGNTTTHANGVLRYDNSTNLMSFGTSGTNNRMVIDASGNVGIGLTAPTAKLNVDAGQILISNNASGFQHTNLGVSFLSQVTAAGAWLGTITNHSMMLYTNNGAPAMTIGTGIQVTANGNMLVTGELAADNTGLNTGSTTNSLRFGSAVSGEAIASKRSATGNQFGLDFYTASTNRMAISNAGNVGIANTAPTEKLDVVGNVKFSGALMPNNAPGTSGQVLMSSGAGLAPTWASPNGINWTLLGNTGTSTLTNWIGTNDANSLLFKTNGIQRMLIESGGNVYVGVPSNPEPDAKLDVVGSNALTNGLNGVFLDIQNSSNTTNNLTGIRFTGSSAANWYTKTAILVPYTNGAFGVSDMVFALNNVNAIGAVSMADARMIIKSNGNVGIGTTSPNFYGGTGKYLSVSSTSVYSANQTAVVELQGASTSAAVPVAKLDFNSVFTAGSPTNTARIALHAPGSIFQGELAFSTHNGTSLNEVLRLTKDGAVGIGTTTPTYKFVMSGATGSAFNGPNMSFVTSEDNYPAMHVLNWNHGEQWLMFNSYYDGSFRSSSASHNFAIASYYGVLNFNYESGVASGGGISWTSGMTMMNNGRVGINTSAPTASLHVNGTTRLVDGTQGTDKVLTSDATGNASWQNGSRNTGFSVYSSVSQTVASGIFTQLTFNGEDYDDGNDFASNQYVCPTAGVYQFNTTVSWSAMANSTSYVFVAFFVNGVAAKYQMAPSHTNYYSQDLSVTMKCNASDVITVRVEHFQAGVESTYGFSNLYTHFSGFRVY
ncbi:MAG TPA: hypothetical protein PLQ93_09085, partial [Bacteroidia bacterium]|nr:hypothetical protein [Bacteroidia bacterium]